MNRLLSVAIALAITVVALTYALWDVDFNELLELLAGVRYAVLIPFLLALFVFYWFKAIRWSLILTPVGSFTALEVAPAMIVGFAGNNVLPARLGEGLRIIVFARRFDKPVSSIAVSLVLERILDVLAILLLILFMAPTTDSAPDALRLSVWSVATLLVIACVSIAIVVVFPHQVVSGWVRVSKHLPKPLAHRSQALLSNVVSAFSTVKSVRRLIVLIVNSLAQWVLMVLLAWLAVWAVGTRISPMMAVMVMGVTALAVTAPSAPGYIGTIQAAFVLALKPFGIADETAFAASVFFLVAQWVPVTAVGALCFIATGMGVSQTRRQIHDMESPPTR